MCNKTADGHCTTPLKPENFGLSIFKKLANQHDLLICSPFSVDVLLTMCCVGAKGETADALKRTLNIKDANASSEKFNRLFTELQKIETVNLLMANKIYVKTGMELKPAFQNKIKDTFHSEVEELDFSDGESSANNINTWVETKTEGKIHELIKSSDLSGDTSLVLLNAVYFKGSWLKPFSIEATSEEPFYVSDGTEKVVEMMHQQEYFYIGENKELNIEILEMSYLGNELSMLIFLPVERDGIKILKNSIHKIDITNLNLKKVDAIIGIPKFKIETEIPLETVLKDMDLAIIFETNANFTNIADQNLCVSNVIQKAFIEVNEEGTEATAATAVQIHLLSGTLDETPPKQFNADHEFIFAIKYKDVILFMGVYS